MHTIYNLVPQDDGSFEEVFVEDFEELPAPAVTLGGRLLALKNETGMEHVAQPKAP
jgi:hypothetical protein